MRDFQKEYEEFKLANKDIFIPESHILIHEEANTPIYLRRWFKRTQ